MRPSLLTLIGLLALPAFALRAQDDVVTLPPGFRVATSANAHWTVTTVFTPPPPAPGVAGAPGAPVGGGNVAKLPPTVVETTRTGDTIHIVTTSGSNVTDRWCYGKMQFVTVPGTIYPVWMDEANQTGGGGIPYLHFGKALFPELAWVSVDTFTGVVEAHGHKCYAFTKMDITAPPEVVAEAKDDARKAARTFDPRPYMGKIVANIDAVTQYPVSVVTPTQTSTYEILPPPTSPLVLPENIQAMAKTILKREDMSAHVRPPQA